MRKTELRKWRENYSQWDLPVLCEGLSLHAHYEEKDYVKELGGRWHPDPSGSGGNWWMPREKLLNPVPDHIPTIVNVFDDSGRVRQKTVLDWLNQNCMISGNHGVMHQVSAKNFLDTHDPPVNCDIYDLVHENGAMMTIRNYEYDIVAFTEVGTTNTVYQTTEAGRQNWDFMMQSGFRLTSPQEEV
tara:strand:- start:58 stop:615 length:558 start_codon:yes stop_codon:yes gene_type:complete